MDTLRQMSLLKGIKPAQKDVPAFHSTFLASVKRYGRIHELGMIIDYTLRSEGPGGLLRQAGMGFQMFMNGKIKLLPRSLRATEQLRNIFRKMEGKG